MGGAPRCIQLEDRLQATRPATGAASVPAGRALRPAALQCTCATKTAFKERLCAALVASASSPPSKAHGGASGAASRAAAPGLGQLWPVAAAALDAVPLTALWLQHTMRQGLPLSAGVQHGSSTRAPPTLPGDHRWQAWLHVGTRHRPVRMGAMEWAIQPPARAHCLGQAAAAGSEKQGRRGRAGKAEKGGPSMRASHGGTAAPANRHKNMALAAPEHRLDKAG